MKRVYILFAAVAAGCLCSWAQLLNVKSIRQVQLPDEMRVTQAAISPDGNTAIVSVPGSPQLFSVNLTDGTVTKVADNGMVDDLTFTKDGQSIVYRVSTVDANRLTYKHVNATNLKTGKTQQIVAPSRSLAGFSVSGTAVNAIQDGKRRAKSLDGTQAAAKPSVGIYRGHLMYNDGKTTKQLDPQGRGSYLWPQLSPDGTKIVYYLSGAGCHICNIDGSDVRPLGYLHAATWLDNNVVVGMQDIDDGTVLTASAIVAADANGTMQRLTGDDMIAVYPTTGLDSGTIAFTDAQGNLYIMATE